MNHTIQSWRKYHQDGHILTKRRQPCTIHTLPLRSLFLVRLDKSIAESEIFRNQGEVDVTRHVIPTLVFDDLAVGDEWESPRRTVTEADVVAFAGVSGDFNPLHMDQHAAREGPFRRPIAHGLLGLSIASGLGAHSPKVDTLAFVAILEWKFLHPIFFGDTIRVLTTVMELHSKGRGKRGVVTWRRRILNQDDQILQEGITQTLIRNRSRSENPLPEEPDNVSTSPDASSS